MADGARSSGPRPLCRLRLPVTRPGRQIHTDAGKRFIANATKLEYRTDRGRPGRAGERDRSGFHTEMNAELYKQVPAVLRYCENRTALGRIGNPEDLAGTLLLLASDA
jgi:hypothetical protein